MENGESMELEEGTSQIEEIEEQKKKNDFKLFGIYDVSEIKINDPGIKKYINVDAKLVVKSSGRIREKFSQSKINVLEVLANLIAVPGHRGKKHRIITGHASGKYTKNMKIVLSAFKIIEGAGGIVKGLKGEEINFFRGFFSDSRHS